MFQSTILKLSASIEIVFWSKSKNLQSALSTVFSWTKRNNVKLNPNKFELIQFNPNKHSKIINIFQNLPFSQIFFNYELPNNTQIK